MDAEATGIAAFDAWLITVFKVVGPLDLEIPHRLFVVVTSESLLQDLALCVESLFFIAIAHSFDLSASDELLHLAFELLSLLSLLMHIGPLLLVVCFQLEQLLSHEVDLLISLHDGLLEDIDVLLCVVFSKLHSLLSLDLFLDLGVHFVPQHDVLLSHL